MRTETIKMYKGAQCVTVDKTDVDTWRGYGYETSSDRQKKSADKKKAAGKKD